MRVMITLSITLALRWSDGYMTQWRNSCLFHLGRGGAGRKIPVFAEMAWFIFHCFSVAILLCF